MTLPYERALVESHLGECPDCAHLAKEYREVGAMLPYALASVSPYHLPSSLKDRLVKKLEVDPIPVRSPSFSEGPGGGRHHLPTMLRPWRRRLRNIGAVAVVILFALSLVWSIRLNVALSRERTLRTGLANLVNQQEVVLETVDSNDTVKIFLSPGGIGSRSYGKFYTRPDLPHVVVIAARLPQPPPGQAYHLWLTSQGDRQLKDVMSVNDQGFGLIVFDADRNGPVYEVIELTLQPEDSTTPSEDSILLWRPTR